MSETLPVVGEITIRGSHLVSIDWSPDGTRLVVGRRVGDLKVVSLEGDLLWSESKLTKGFCFVRWSPDGRWIAVSGANKRGVLSAQDGAWLWSTATRSGSQVDFDPTGQQVGFAASGSEQVMIARVLSGEQVSSFSASEYVSQSLAFSPDGRALVIGRMQRPGKAARIDLVDRVTGALLHQMAGGAGIVHGLRWSPQGDRLACAIADRNKLRHCLILDRRGLRVERELAPGGTTVWSLDWAKHGDLLAIGSYHAGVVHVFRGRDGERLAHFVMPGRSYWTAVAFSPDGRLLAATNTGLIRIFDTSAVFEHVSAGVVPRSLRQYATRQVATVGRPLGGEAHHLASTAALYSLDLTPPLSLLRQLDDLLAGRVPEGVPEDFRDHPGVSLLRRLRWPPESRTGLIALLLHKLPAGAWRPPPGTASVDLRSALAEALDGDPMPARPEAFPGVLLRQAADSVGAGLVGLLEMVGPGEVHEDPGLPLRLLSKVSLLPAMARARRRLLSADLISDQQGRAERRTAGGGLSGIRRRGRPEALLPSQLALPPEVLALRHLRGDLLYRAHSGGEPPRFRPTVIVLDVSPPTFGPVEKVTRLAAMLVGRTLLEAGLPAILVTAGGRSRFHVLDRRSRLLSCWTERSLEPVRLAEMLRVAEALRETLRGGPLEPRILLLSHLGFGAEGASGPLRAARALLVRYPGQSQATVGGDGYERMRVVDSSETEGLPRILRGLIG